MLSYWQHLGGDNQLYPLVLACYDLAFLVAAPLLGIRCIFNFLICEGKLSDNHSFALTYGISLVFLFGGNICYALASTLSNKWLIVVGRTLAGVGSGITNEILRKLTMTRLHSHW